jgi:hypothetical protein
VGKGYISKKNYFYDTMCVTAIKFPFPGFSKGKVQENMEQK